MHLKEFLIPFAGGGKSLLRPRCPRPTASSDEPVLHALVAHVSREEVRAAAEQNIRTTASHVGRNRDLAFGFGLGNDFRFKSACAEHFVRNADSREWLLRYSLRSTLMVPTSTGCPVA